MRGLVLASASPRRRELLTLLGVDFDSVVPAVEELSEGDPAGLVVENALRKARGGAALAPPGSVVVGVDTDVSIDGSLLGKAVDDVGAAARIQRLSGRVHEVLSGVAIVEDSEERTELVRTQVGFRSLTETEIAAYVASGEWRDRAGGYAVQGLGAALIERVEGDLSNVIGLPIPALSRMIPGLQDR